MLTAKTLLPAVLAAALWALPGAARAQTAAGTLTLQANVQRSCTLFAIPLMFGMFPPGNVTVNAQSNINVTCTPGTPFSVAIDNGLNFGGGSRRMRRLGGGGGGQWLRYEIYRNAARTQRWGTSAAQIVSGVAPANGGSVALIAYGRASGNPSAGPYDDFVTVTLTF